MAKGFDRYIFPYTALKLAQDNTTLGFKFPPKAYFYFVLS